jgi:hypothetical protein
MKRTRDVTERLMGGAIQFCVFLASTPLDDAKYSQSLSNAGIEVPLKIAMQNETT